MQPPLQVPVKIVGIILWAALLCACTNTRVLDNWPQPLPPQHYFMNAYHADATNQPLQSEAEYLTWIVRFYEGWELMPTGWHEITSSMLIGLDERDTEKVEDSLKSLGASISAEWAKDNSARTIDSAMLSLWGAVMQADFSSQARVAAVEKILADVSGLLAGTLTPAQITEGRYSAALGISLDP